MATLLVGAAVNIGVGLLLNALFPPPDIEQAGPRLTDLGFTSASYGRFVNVVFGTDRVSGNIIDTTDPAIEEVVTVESTSAKGGQKINTTTYTYFLTCRISFCIEGAEAILRLWGDGKLILDKTGSSQVLKEGTSLTFYPGGPNQPQDAEEVARRGSDIPAYRHLTSVKLDRMPLADYGNRIPNFTAEIAFATDGAVIPFLNMDEPPGLDVPGSLTGAGSTFMSFNPDRNELYSLKPSTTGVWAADASTLQFKNIISNGATSGNPLAYAVGRDGFAYMQEEGNNSAPLEKVDIETSGVVGSFGDSGTGLFDTTANFVNGGIWHQLQVTLPYVGVQSVVFHLNRRSAADPNGSIIDPILMPLPVTGNVTTPVVHIISTDDGLASGDDLGLSEGIPDHDRGRFFILQNDVVGNEYRLVEYTPEYGLISGVGGPAISKINTRVVRQFTRGTLAAGDDFEGSGAVLGWAVNRTTGDLILSNGTSMILYNPDDDAILASRAGGVSSFKSQNNYYSGNTFAWGISDASNGTIRVIDVNTLNTVRDILTDDIGWQGADGRIDERSVVWDDRTQAVFLSRVDVGSTAVDPNRILKVFVNRLDAAGVPLSEVVQALSTSYQRQTMAGLQPEDLDVTTLAGDTVQGYTINRKSTMKAALEPLRARYQFDAVQSDWIMKFPKRGTAPTLTIPEEDVGLLKRGRELTDEPPVQELRADDLSLPMSLSINYKNKNIDYQIDVERDKRHLHPNPTMRSKSELSIDIPIVDTATAMKQTAQEQLLTMWNERVSYRSVIPWTYLKLDSTDVFNLGVFGETAQLRMAELNLGAGWAIEFTGVVQDTKSFSSTLTGGSPLGHVTKLVPSSLPTRLVPLDAPLLSLQDLLISPVSNAYMAVSAFENTWPGATVMKSVDNIQYNASGTVDTEVPLAKVLTPPGAWGYVEGDFPNRIQEVSDGGTLTIRAIRRPTFWTSASEVDMLSGANHMAIRGTDGEVEIVGFVDVTDNGDNTFTLDRLLRGRLGTEDIADGGVLAGDEVIGLSGSSNTKESRAIVRQSLPLSQLDSSVFFKGVTVGTFLEDVQPISATYTGRDIKPYSVVHTAASFNSGDVDVVWERRVRGPLAGEWLDLTGDVPLNENIEQYEIVISDGTTSVTGTALAGTGFTFDAADISALSGTLTVTVVQVSDTGLKSPITPASTATVV